MLFAFETGKNKNKKNYKIKRCLDRVSNNHNNIKSLGVKVSVCSEVQISESLWTSWISSLAQQSFTAAFSPSPSCALALSCRVWGAERLKGILYTVRHAGEHCCFGASEQVAFAPGSSQPGIAFGYPLQYQLFRTHLFFLDAHPALELLTVCLLL